MNICTGALGVIAGIDIMEHFQGFRPISERWKGEIASMQDFL